MKLSGSILTIGCCISGTAAAGGLLLPGAGAVSTARAGASVAAVDDGESIVMNPAGIAKSEGTFVQLGITAIDYFLSFQRNGTYDPLASESTSYAGMRYPVMENDAKPPLGFGSVQPVPVIAIVTDFGKRIPGLHGAFGIYAPNAYPFRDFNKVNGKQYFIPKGESYAFPVFGDAPPPTRYDMIHEEAAVILPSIDLAYRVIPDLDLGLRLSSGTAQLNSTITVWGVPANYEENIKADGIFTLKAKDNFVPSAGLGAAYRPTKEIELGARYNFPIQIHAQGEAYSTNGPNVLLGVDPVVILPLTGNDVDGTPRWRCADGGTTEAQKGCVDVELPMTASVGGRYKFLDEAGKMKGDVELDVDWERWGKTCDYTKDPTCLDASDFKVTIDGKATTPNALDSGISLQPQRVSHGLQNTYAMRLGGSYAMPVGANTLIARGGVSYDTAAAKPGWERVDLDGAARTTIAAGASYKLARVQIDAGVGVILEGTRTDSRTCNPTSGAGMGCAGTPGYSGGTPGTDNPVDSRQGPDPVNPIIRPEVQAESPVNAGTFKSHYLMFMLGASYHF